MTDEPDEAWKPIKAALVLFALLLSALAPLAGCKSEPPITRPKASYLHFDDDSVTFVEWAQAWDKLEGTIKTLNRKPDNEVVTTVFVFYGALYDTEVSLTLTSSGNAQDGYYPIDKTIRGALIGNTLALPPVNKADVLGTEQFRRATPEEFAEASRKLEMRAKLNKGAY
jgi:hypothetical protein